MSSFVEALNPTGFLFLKPIKSESKALSFEPSPFGLLPVLDNLKNLGQLHKEYVLETQ